MINYVRQIFQRNYFARDHIDDNSTNVICPACKNVQYAGARLCNNCRYII